MKSQKPRRAILKNDAIALGGAAVCDLNSIVDVTTSQSKSQVFFYKGYQRQRIAENLFQNQWRNDRQNRH
jgi:hypothetical protein